jgi:hypothetical protein
MSVGLTNSGKNLLDVWRRQGMIGKTAVINTLVQEVEDGTTGYREALILVGRLAVVETPETARQLSDQLGGATSALPMTRTDNSVANPSDEDKSGVFASMKDDSAVQAGLYIDAMCSQWAGLTRQDAYHAAVRERTNAPHHPGLPQWLDPEVKLPSDHSLRKVRQQMEESLAVANGDWQTLDNGQKAALRTKWLQENKGLHPDLEMLFDVPGADFSALKYWLTGQR